MPSFVITAPHFIRNLVSVMIVEWMHSIIMRDNSNLLIIQIRSFTFLPKRPQHWQISCASRINNMRSYDSYRWLIGPSILAIESSHLKKMRVERGIASPALQASLKLEALLTLVRNYVHNCKYRRNNVSDAAQGLTAVNVSGAYIQV